MQLTLQSEAQRKANNSTLFGGAGVGAGSNLTGVLLTTSLERPVLDMNSSRFSSIFADFFEVSIWCRDLWQHAEIPRLTANYLRAMMLVYKCNESIYIYVSIYIHTIYLYMVAANPKIYLSLYVKSIEHIIKYRERKRKIYKKHSHTIQRNENLGYTLGMAPSQYQ